LRFLVIKLFNKLFMLNLSKHGGQASARPWASWVTAFVFLLPSMAKEMAIHSQT
jgi:hypothetical protein